MKDTDIKKEKPQTARREFLKGAAVASAAAGAGVLATDAIADETTSETKKSQSLGYQETKHVREYYRLARF
ncbi:MAG: twin-arginine translocation signal domain-containing protein [Acidiferrobacterales bacterium]|nr:twin-arginine translocation signal domain-containing protein [Acidiferrobacterales bacterium]